MRTDGIAGQRDQASIGVMMVAFARISATCDMNVANHHRAAAPGACPRWTH